MSTTCTYNLEHPMPAPMLKPVPRTPPEHPVRAQNTSRTPGACPEHLQNTRCEPRTPPEHPAVPRTPPEHRQNTQRLRARDPCSVRPCMPCSAPVSRTPGVLRTPPEHLVCVQNTQNTRGVKGPHDKGLCSKLLVCPCLRSTWIKPPSFKKHCTAMELDS